MAFTDESHICAVKDLYNSIQPYSTNEKKTVQLASSRRLPFKDQFSIIFFHGTNRRAKKAHDIISYANARAF